MSGFSYYVRHALAALGALVLSTAILANSVGTQPQEVRSVVGIFA